MQVGAGFCVSFGMCTCGGMEPGLAGLMLTRC